MKIYGQAFRAVARLNRRSSSLFVLMTILGGTVACGQAVNSSDSEVADRPSRTSPAILAAAGAGQADRLKKQFYGDFQEPFLATKAGDRTSSSNETTARTIFDPSQVSVGDRVAGVTLVALEAEPLGEDTDIYTGTARFQGKIILEGIYHPPYEPGEEDEYGRLWNEGPCLQVAPEARSRLPRMQGDFRAPWLCFDNSERAAELLPDSTPRARVRVAVDNYQIQHAIPDKSRAFAAEGVHRARLIEVLEGGTADRDCVRWNDFQSAVRSGRLAFRSPIPILPESYQTRCVIAEHGAHALNLYVLPEGHIPETITTPRSMQDWAIFQVVPFGILRDRPKALQDGVAIVRYDSGLVAEQLAKEKAWSAPYVYDENTVLFRSLWLESQTIPVEKMVEVLAATRDEWDRSNSPLAGPENFCGEAPETTALPPSSETREIHLPEHHLSFEIPANYQFSRRVSPSTNPNQDGKETKFVIYDPDAYDYVLCAVRNRVATHVEYDSAYISVLSADVKEPWRNKCSATEILEYDQRIGIGKEIPVDSVLEARPEISTSISISLVDEIERARSCLYSPSRESMVSASTQYLGAISDPFDSKKIHNLSLYRKVVSSLRFSESSESEVSGETQPETGSQK